MSHVRIPTAGRSDATRQTPSPRPLRGALVLTAALFAVACGELASVSTDGGDAPVRADARDARSPVDVRSSADRTAPDTTTRADAQADTGVDASHPDAPTSDATHPDAPSDSTLPDTGTRDAAPDAPTCAPPTTLCDAGCLDLSNDPNHCGSCSNDCTTLPNVDPSTVSCQSGRCIATCKPGYAACDDAGAGCPASLSSPEHCGSCTAACGGSTPVCAPIPLDAGVDAEVGDSGLGCTNGCSPLTDTVCDGGCVDLSSDLKHCGSCAIDCSALPSEDPSLARCTSRRCMLDLAFTGGDFAWQASMAIDATNVYWWSGQTLYAVRKDGTGFPEILAEDRYWGRCGEVMLTSAGLVVSAGEDVAVTSRDGGALRELVVDDSGIGDIAVTSSTVYWIAADAGIMSVPLDGGASVTFAASSDAYYMAATADALFWRTQGGDVMSKPLDGGAATVLAAGQSGGDYSMIATNATTVCWTPGDGVSCMPLSGGPVTTFLPGLQFYPGLALDEENLYAIATGTSVLFKVPLSGDGGAAIPTLGLAADSIAVDDAGVYVLTESGVLLITPK